MNNDESKQTDNINHNQIETMESENITCDNDNQPTQKKSGRGGYQGKRRKSGIARTKSGNSKSQHKVLTVHNQLQLLQFHPQYHLYVLQVHHNPNQKVILSQRRGALNQLMTLITGKSMPLMLKFIEGTRK